jgi:hypothetical protein
MAFALPAGITTSTINDYMKAVSEPIYRESILLGFLRKRKRIKFRQTGPNFVWPVRYYRQKWRQIQGAVTATQYANIAPEIQLTLGMAGWDMGRSCTKAEKLANQAGETQIYDLIGRILDQLVGDFTEQLRLSLWSDGTLNPGGMMGLMSIFGATTTPSADGFYINPNTSAYTLPTVSTNTVANGYWWAANPGQTYAGQSLALGSKVSDYSSPTDSGGTNLYAFPQGTFSPGYNFLSPLIVDYNSHYWTPNPQDFAGGATAGTHEWESCWQQAVNAAFTYLQLLQRDKPDLVVLDADLLRRAKDSTIGQQRFEVTGTSEARSIGIETLSYNGHEFATEYGVPPGCAFILNLGKVMLRSWQGDLMERTTDKDPTTSEDLYKVDTYIQNQIDSPANIAGLFPITTVVAGS